MYIIEIIAKFLQNRKEKKQLNIDLDEELESCEHIYVAIDSSKTYLACYKCGNLIENNGEIKINKNPFSL
ncbi:MAG: hypothetical protein WCK67_04495 [bacterium]